MKLSSVILAKTPRVAHLPCIALQIASSVGAAYIHHNITNGISRITTYNLLSEIHVPYPLWKHRKECFKLPIETDGSYKCHLCLQLLLLDFLHVPNKYNFFNTIIIKCRNACFRSRKTETFWNNQEKVWKRMLGWKSPAGNIWHNSILVCTESSYSISIIEKCHFFSILWLRFS